MARVQSGGGLAQRKLVVLLAALLLLLGVDSVVLRGEHVGHATVYFDRPEPLTFVVDRVGATHLIEIRSPRRVQGEEIGFRVSYWVETPDGEKIPGGSEIRTHEQRSFRFVPRKAGEYAVHVQREGLMMASSGGSAQVDVYANDRRVLPRLLERLPL
jgi:hypothetical protein